MTTTVGVGEDDVMIPLAPVTELLKLFVKAMRAHQLYLPNNPMHARAIDALRAAFSAVWAHTDVLDLVVTDTAFLCEDRPALEEPGRGADSLSWLMYKDGVRALEFRQGFEGRDLDILLDLIQRARMRGTDDDDLVTMLWEREFEFFAYRYIELAAEGVGGAPGAELMQGGAGTGTIPIPSSVEGPVDAETAIGGGGAPPASAPFARVDDFDTTLYFLEDQEIEYLRQAIREDFSTDLRFGVIAALLDTFEQEEDPTVREEIFGILEHSLTILLTHMHFRAVAYLLRETTAAAERATNIEASQRSRLLELSGRMSEPTVFAQLLQALEETILRPPQDDLNELLGELRPAALELILAHLARTQNAELRALLESAASRIIAGNSAELVRLIGSDNEAVAMSAIRRAGAFRSPAAVVPLSKVLGSPTLEARKLAASALADIGSTGALQVLERAIDDEDREVRVIAVRAAGERQYRAALPRIERGLKERVLAENQHALEKAAFFDAYATLAGDAGVAFLDAILNPKGFLGRKEDTQTRAHAATALGKVGTPRALDALRKAAGDKDVVIRTAASRALRGPS